MYMFLTRGSSLLLLLLCGCREGCRERGGSVVEEERRGGGRGGRRGRRTRRRYRCRE
jgi:hypothetical protein